MPRDPYIREKFTKERNAARAHTREYFERYPVDRYETKVDEWRKIQSDNIEWSSNTYRTQGGQIP